MVSLTFFVKMSVLSSLRRAVIGGGLGLRSKAQPANMSAQPIRQILTSAIRHGSGLGAGAGGHGRKMVVKVSEFQKRKVFDELHYLIMLCSAPFIVIIFVADVFIGPATLTEIPEGYEPEEWEYYKHPLERFYAKYMFHPLPVMHEIKLSSLHQDICAKEKREWEYKCEELISERQDYKAWYFIPSDPYAVEKAYAFWHDLKREEGRGVPAPQGYGLKGISRVSDIWC